MTSEIKTITPARDADRPVVFLHIGAPKTGTTFLQRILWQNRGVLSDAGVLYPGNNFGAHVRAAFDLRGAGFHRFKDPEVAGTWQSFVDEARDWQGPVIISQELFSPATAAQIDRAMTDLSFADVHLIYTARELSKQIPAAWQEDVKNRFTPTFDEFVEALRNPTLDPQNLGQMFWRMQDGPEVLKRWARMQDPANVHVISVPPRADPPDLLWRRFARVVGVDPSDYDTSDAFANTSLGAAEVSVLRRLNLALDDEVGWPLYNELVKHYLAQDFLVQRKSSAIRLRKADAEWAIARSAVLVDELGAAGYDIVGSLDELRPNPDPGTDIEVSVNASVEEQLEVAIDALAALLLRISRLRRKVVRA